MAAKATMRGQGKQNKTKQNGKTNVGKQGRRWGEEEQEWRGTDKSRKAGEQRHPRALRPVIPPAHQRSHPRS